MAREKFLSPTERPGNPSSSLGAGFFEHVTEPVQLCQTFNLVDLRPSWVRILPCSFIGPWGSGQNLQGLGKIIEVTLSSQFESDRSYMVNVVY